MKKLACLFLSAVLMGCQAVPPQILSEDHSEQKVTYAAEANPEFDEYLHDYVVESCQDSYITMHQYFENPEDYGIDPAKAEISLGTLKPDEEEVEEAQEWEDKLNEFDYDSLSLTQQNIYDQLQWENQLFEEGDKDEFEYSGSLWSAMEGQQEILITFFTEYEIRKEADIQPLLDLINDTPRYIKECLEFSEEQAQREMLYLDYDAVIESCQETLASKDDSDVYAGLAEEIDQLNLDEAKADSYKKQIKDALDQSFFPSYQMIIDGLGELEPAIQPVTGLANQPNGKDYYKLLLKDATGSDVTPEDAYDNLHGALGDLEEEFSVLMRKNPGAVFAAEEISTDFKSVDEILVYLQDNYTKLFPKLDTMHYDLAPLPDEQSNVGQVAYFVNPPIDNTQEYLIRYNRRDYGEDPTSLEMYTTMAHEGIPGHMYQAQYDHQFMAYPIQYFFSNLGYSEGYATYVEEQALKLLNIDQDTAKAYQTNKTYNNFYTAILDIEINYNGKTKAQIAEEYGEGLDEAYDMIADNPTAFMSYYYGYYEISQLRAKARKALGDDFSDVDFNNTLLENGSVNFSTIQKTVDRYIEESKTKENL